MNHVRKQYNRWSFRLSILGKYVDAGESYDDEVSAGFGADLAKHYLASEYRLVLPPSLDGDLFSSLAYSRHNVDLLSSYSVEKALAPGVKNFINENAIALLAHKDLQPAPSLSSKFRNSGMFSDPKIKDWVEKCEAADLRQRAFSAINHVYFFSLLDALSSRLTDALGPLRRAVKMHERVEDAVLVDRAGKLRVLLVHMKLNLEYINELTVELRAEQASVESAVATLEANRPNLS